MPSMYALSLAAGTLVPLTLLLASGAAGAQLIPGIDDWADAVVGLSTRRWTGQRVPVPVPEARPEAHLRLDSTELPISVHAPKGVGPSRLREVLRAAELVHLALSEAGFRTRVGDGGRGGTAGRDVYVTPSTRGAARAALDAAGELVGLDGASAFVVLDAWLPSDRVLPCTAHALLEAELLELDPAEAAILRESSAAYLGTRIAGEPTCEGDEQPRDPAIGPFASGASGTAGADWLARLDARQDEGRGRFLQEMWQFARQRTWEGEGLRGSPDLLEAIAKALDLERDELSRVAAQIAEARVLDAQDALPAVRWEELPASTRERAIAPLGATFAIVRLGTPRPGARLRAWSSSETGGRFTLTATRLGRDGAPLSRLEATPRPGPVNQLSIELDAETHAVLVGAVNVEDGTPDLDDPSEPKRVALTFDVAP